MRLGRLMAFVCLISFWCNMGCDDSKFSALIELNFGNANSEVGYSETDGMPNMPREFVVDERNQCVYLCDAVHEQRILKFNFNNSMVSFLKWGGSDIGEPEYFGMVLNNKNNLLLAGRWQKQNFLLEFDTLLKLIHRNRLAMPETELAGFDFGLLNNEVVIEQNENVYFFSQTGQLINRRKAPGDGFVETRGNYYLELKVKSDGTYSQFLYSFDRLIMTVPGEGMILGQDGKHNCYLCIYQNGKKEDQMITWVISQSGKVLKKIRLDYLKDPNGLIFAKVGESGSVYYIPDVFKDHKFRIVRQN